MSYHPIMGITIFIIFLILAFLLGKNFSITKKKKDNVIALKKKKLAAVSISPDATWLN